MTDDEEEAVTEWMVANACINGISKMWETFINAYPGDFVKHAPEIVRIGERFITELISHCWTLKTLLDRQPERWQAIGAERIHEVERDIEDKKQEAKSWRKRIN